MNDAVFVLDTSVFVEAARRYYAFDLVPGFWETLIVQARVGSVVSIDRVEKELRRQKDDLARWATRDFDTAFVSTDQPSVSACYRDIINWVQNQPRFKDAAKSKFAQDADGWVIAYAKATGSVLVTQEVSSPESRRKVKIPDVCEVFGVSTVDTFQMLRRLDVRLT